MSDSIHIQISAIEELNLVPSASGITYFQNGFVLIGDNSPYLFFLDQNCDLLKKIEIFSVDELIGETIAKKVKPDFEAFELISEHEVMVLGSGSRIPKRAKCILLNLITQERRTHDISSIYSSLLDLPEMDGSELNIEALASTEKDLYLFNRSNNLIFCYSKTEFIAAVLNTGPLSPKNIYSFNLPQLNDIESGFSGATITTDGKKIIFTSSVEDTDNAYDDGEILGSFIGTIEIENQLANGVYNAVEVSIKDKKLKIESVTVTSESNTTLNLSLVTDNDGLPSEIIRAQLQF